MHALTTHCSAGRFRIKETFQYDSVLLQAAAAKDREATEQLLADQETAEQLAAKRAEPTVDEGLRWQVRAI